jgi:hypothetical protein
MTGFKVEQEMLRLAADKKNSLNDKLKSLDDKQITAMRAYRISISILDQASKMVAMKFSSQAHDEKYYAVREDRIFKAPGVCYFADEKAWYDDETAIERKQAFLVYAHAVQMVHSAFLDKKIDELKKAQNAHAVEAKFEIQMVIDTLSDLLKEWEEWWINANA